MQTIARILVGFVREIAMSRATLQLENIALRQQVAVLKRERPRPRLRPLDRVFWVFISRLWPRWKDALVIVKPETVVGWHVRGSACSGNGNRATESRVARKLRRKYANSSNE